MRATVIYGERDIRLEEVADPILSTGGDAIVRVVAACVCGSDLWPYRGVQPTTEPHRIGHEFVGVVEAVGPDVRTIKVGDFVIAPFYDCDNTCINCRNGVSTSCLHGGWWGSDDRLGGFADGAQGEKVRVPHADGSFGATDIVDERGEAGVARIRELFDGIGADCVLECVGTKESMDQAIESARPGGMVGYVGVPTGGPIAVRPLFGRNVGLNGGVAPVRGYVEELLPEVLSGAINPGRVFDLELPLAEVAEAYAAMDERRAIKVLLRP